MKLSKNLIVIAAVPALALAASACSTSAQAAVTPFVYATSTVSGVYSTQAQTAYNMPNNDVMNVSATVTVGATAATVKTLVDGAAVNTVSVTDFYGSASRPGTQTLSLGPITVAGGSTHVYTVEVLDANGAVLATSKPVTTKATLFPKAVPSAALQTWENTYGNWLAAILNPDVATVQASLNATGYVPILGHISSSSQLHNDVTLYENGSVPAPPITNAGLLNCWKLSLGYLYQISYYNSTATNLGLISSAESYATSSGVEW